MKQKSRPDKAQAEQVLKNIRRQTRGALPGRGRLQSRQKSLKRCAQLGASFAPDVSNPLIGDSCVDNCIRD
jgi:hypothetical protein